MPHCRLADSSDAIRDMPEVEVSSSGAFSWEASVAHGSFQRRTMEEIEDWFAEVKDPEFA